MPTLKATFGNGMPPVPEQPEDGQKPQTAEYFEHVHNVVDLIETLANDMSGNVHIWSEVYPCQEHDGCHHIMWHCDVGGFSGVGPGLCDAAQACFDAIEDLNDAEKDEEAP